MKRVTIFLAMVALILFAGSAMAQTLKPAKHAGVEASADSAGNFSIPALPSGQVVDVEVYNDRDGTPVRHLGPKMSGKLDPCDGLNFVWRDSKGSQFQLITRGTKAGGSLETDCSWKDEKGIPRCKYLYTGGQNCKE